MAAVRRPIVLDRHLKCVRHHLPLVRAVDVDREEGLQFAIDLMADKCDGLSIWRDLGIAVALSGKWVGRQAQAGKIQGVIPHEEDSVSAGTVDAFVNEVMSIGSEGRLGMKTCRSQIVKIGAIGIDDRDPPVRVIVE